MDDPKLSGIRHLVGADYFHQDWVYDHKTPEAVVEEFIREEPPWAVQSALVGVAELLRRDDVELAACLDAWGNSYYTPAHNRTQREWLETVQARLQSADIANPS